MRIYMAGKGHKIHKNKKFIRQLGRINLLLSFYYLGPLKDGEFLDRFEWIKKYKG